MSPHALALVVGLVSLSFLFATARVWNAPDTPQRHWLLLVGIAILPSLALLLGTNATLEDAERPEFCGSCHVMTPWIHDLKDPASTTLAAAHYQNRWIPENQCYTCHTDYKIFKPFRGKLAGMRHVWRFETGRYTLPITLAEPYRIENCLHCHGEARNFRDKHADVLPTIESGDMSCLDCHRPIHPDAPAS